MSTEPDKDTLCPDLCDKAANSVPISEDSSNAEKNEDDKTTKKSRTVSFPADDQLVTQYFEPANPWQDVPSTTRAQLAAEYLEACRRHNTPPIEGVLQQIRELPENTIGGCSRAPRLSLSDCVLLGAAPADALEALLRKVQFRRLEVDHAAMDDEGAEAIFDMIEYYESAVAVCIIGPRQFGIRGWQAASRMIKKSAELSELEVAESPLEASHAPVLARALRPLTCRLRALCLQRADLSGEPLLCLVIALKSNSSVRELRLGDNRLTSSDAAQIASLLRLNTRLQLLDLSNNQIQDAGAGHIADALVEQAAQTPPSDATSPVSPHQCPLMGYDSRGLAFLVLWNNQLTRNCAHHLNKALRSSQSLCVLNVGRNALGAEAVRALAAGSALVSLGLQAARLGPDAGPALADLLRADTSLQRLDLRENRLGGAGLQALVSAMKENTTLTQIDLDDPVEARSEGPEECSDGSEASVVARLTRELRALCRRNEPTADRSDRPHRKISLTCHTTCLPKALSAGCAGAGGPERRGRLRSPLPSPAPSPAGSPVPAHHHHQSRFSVTKVTPERESSTDSSSPSTPTRPSYCPAPSRFRVVQVAEPPQIQVHPATTSQPRRSSSRFSVTRNYDIVYNPTLVQSVRTPEPIKPLVKPDASQADATRTEIKQIRDTVNVSQPARLEITKEPDTKKNDPVEIIKSNLDKPITEIANPGVFKSFEKHEEPGSKLSGPSPIESETLASSKQLEVKTDITSEPNIIKFDVEKGPDKDNLNDHITSCTETETNESKPEQVRNLGEINNEDDQIACDAKYRTDIKTDSDSESIKNDIRKYSDVDKNNSELKSDKLDKIKDKTEQITHSEEVDDEMLKTETKLVKNSLEVSESDKVDVQVEVTVRTESMQPAKVTSDQNVDFRNIDDINIKEKREGTAMKQIEAITEDLGNLIKEMQDLSTKTSVLTRKDVKNDCTQTDIVELDKYDKIDTFENVPANVIRNNVVLKKNKSESSLDSPDLEVSRLMNKKLVGSPFCDSSSSLEISGSSVESLNALDQQNIPQAIKPIIIQTSVESDTELDRRKSDHVTLSTDNSIESNTSEVTPVNCGNFLTMSVSSNESVSPIIFGKSKKIHDSLSSLEASVSSLDSGRHEKVMVTSADSGIEYSLQNPSESKDDNSSNEGTLTHNSSLKETVKKPESFQQQDTLTSPKRTSSLLDVPALKGKGIDRIKMPWVAPSSSFHIPRPEPEKEMKQTSHLEKLLSLFQHPSSLFSRTNEEGKKTSNTPPRKDSALTSSFWSWGVTTEKDKEDKSEDRDSSSEATDSTLSERVQVSFVDESFSKKLDSKTPSTDTDNTLSEFQTFQASSETSDASQDLEKNLVTHKTTDEFLVQKNLVLSKTDNASSNGNNARASDNTDLMKPNDLNKNVVSNTAAGDSNKNPGIEDRLDKDKEERDAVRPRTFAAVLKSSGSENSLDKQNSPDTGQPVDKLPSKVIRGIKENISPENTLTSSMSNTKALVIELSEKQIKNQPIVNTMWSVTAPLLDKNEPLTEDAKVQTDMAPIATIEETCEDNLVVDFIDAQFDDKNTSGDSGVTSLEGVNDDKKIDIKSAIENLTSELENVDVGKDALSYLVYENQDFDPDGEQVIDSKVKPGSLAEELKEAEIKQMLDLSPELIIDEAIEVPEIFTAKDVKGLSTSPVIPERAKLKKSNSLEDLCQLGAKEKDSPKTKTIAFKVPEISTTPRDIPERKTRLRTRSGSSPKSLPESLNKPCPLTKMDTIMCKKKKKVSSLGKMARDSLLALNMSEEEIAEFRKSHKLTSVESLRSLESVSEDANSQTSIDSRCRACLRTSQESLMSLDSITEDCRCADDDKAGHSNR